MSAVLSRRLCQVLLALAPALPAVAALAPEAAAPDFTVQASKAGEPFSFSLSEQLKKGPVVLYFYPAAFTKGCTIEAHAFAEAVDKFAAYHATVIGVSHDTIDTLNKFSVSECQSKFAVAADTDLKIAKAYDALHPTKPEYSSRTSYVITPDGKVLYSYDDMKPDQHVANTLSALAGWAQQHPH